MLGRDADRRQPPAAAFVLVAAAGRTAERNEWRGRAAAGATDDVGGRSVKHGAASAEFERAGTDGPVRRVVGQYGCLEPATSELNRCEPDKAGRDKPAVGAKEEDCVCVTDASSEATTWLGFVAE